MFNNQSFARLSSDDSDFVWRYMDFTKFISLLESESLFFSRADKFQDPFEGATPLNNIHLRELRLNSYLSLHPDNDREDYLRRMKIHFKNKAHLRKRVAVNCWHQNNYESEAMWKLYVPSGEGIAIRTTIKNLKNSLANYDEPMEISNVNYINYERDLIHENLTLAPFITKRKSFEHEREIRALIYRPGDDLNTHVEYSFSTIDLGIFVPLNLNILIKDIYIAPTANEWFSDLIKRVIKRYSFNFKVSQSNLKKNPLF